MEETQIPVADYTDHEAAVQQIERQQSQHNDKDDEVRSHSTGLTHPRNTSN